MEHMDVDEYDGSVPMDSILAMPINELRNYCDGQTCVTTLAKISDKIDTNDDTKLDIVARRVRVLVRDVDEASTLDEFNARVDMIVSYNILSRLAGNAVKKKDKGRLRIVTKRINKVTEEGRAKRRVRVSGTGTRVKKEFTYIDNRINREKGIVGKTYTRDVWEDAEYEMVDRVPRRRRIRDEGDETKNDNVWVKAIREARREMNVHGLVPLRREAKDPNDEQQILGERLYLRAREIMNELKARG